MRLQQILQQIIQNKFNDELIEKAKAQQTSINTFINANPITDSEITQCFDGLGLKYTNSDTLERAKKSLRDQYEKLAKAYLGRMYEKLAKTSLDSMYVERSVPNKNLPDEISWNDDPDLQISLLDIFKSAVSSMLGALRSPLKNLFIVSAKYSLASTVVGLISWGISSTNNHFISKISFLNKIVTASGAQGAAAGFLGALCFGALMVGVGLAAWHLYKTIFSGSSTEPYLVNSYARNVQSTLLNTHHKDQNHKKNTRINYSYDDTYTASSNNYSVSDFNNGIYGGFGVGGWF